MVEFFFNYHDCRSSINREYSQIPASKMRTLAGFLPQTADPCCSNTMMWCFGQWIRQKMGFFLISYWDFLQSFLKSPKNNTKQLYLNGSKMNHLSQSQWRSFLTFCQMSSNCSTPSATFFRHRSISPGGEERSRTTERIREKRERHY